MSNSINPHLKVTNKNTTQLFFVEKTIAVFLGDNLHNIKKTKRLFFKKKCTILLLENGA
jgi:hypothetical protein